MSVITKDLGIATAYGYAKSKGYTGTEEEFAELMASYADVAQQAEAAAQDAEDAKEEAVTAKTDAQTAKTAAQAAQSAAETASGTASTKASEAAQSAQTAAGSATAAGNSATAAAGSATTAQTAAQTATTKASEASSSASAASTAKTGAETARTGAQSAQTAAETAQENAEAAAASVSASAAQIDQNTADIGQIKNDFSELESQTKANEKYLIGVENLITGTSWVSGYRINADGTIDEQINSAYTYPITVTQGMSYKYVDNAARSDLYTYIIGYNNNTFVATLASLSGTTGVRNVVFTIPDTVNAIRVSRSDYNQSVSLAQSKTIQDKIDDINDQIDDIRDDISISGYFKKVTGFSGVTTYGGYVNSSGEIINASTGWVRTDYIPTAEGATVSASLKGYITNPIIAYYDANKQYLGTKSVLSNSQLIVTVNSTVPSGVAYAIFVSQTTYDDRMFEIGTPASVNDAFDIVSETLYKYQGLKVLCMGDSLTLGRDGNGNILAHNYPYYMKESALRECVINNAGVSGSTSKTYWDSHISDVSFDNTIDLILCMWGTNGGLVDVNALATDVEPYNDYEDYADTGVGCYCKIIEYAMEQTQNKAQIVLLTPPYNGDSSINSRVINAQPVVKAIADRYGLPVIDMFKCGIGAFNYSTYMPVDSVHFNEDGYKWIGTYIGSCVSAISAKYKT